VEHRRAFDVDDAPADVVDVAAVEAFTEIPGPSPGRSSAEAEMDVLDARPTLKTSPWSADGSRQECRLDGIVDVREVAGLRPSPWI
jgi:hypothetical protein